MQYFFFLLPEKVSTRLFLEKVFLEKVIKTHIMHDCENGFWHLLTLINRCVKKLLNLYSIKDTQIACTVELQRSRWLVTFEALILINVYVNNPFKNDTIFSWL